MNLLLYADYILHADVLQPEPNNNMKMFEKMIFKTSTIFGPEGILFNLKGVENKELKE